ncbi:MAG: hypothetical protein DWQ44_13630 [Bacteroidetes bacterium]|nr:MAG: hypothetical protein DWQ33_08440 [Bacteroidota bacterium]REK05699.1 MAG: hypothetical protein DWQ39_04615 [Bacteroidota bacterium]REK31995.1 MAG: hypothetical protein DWQ44_13630 [Bacteroidota bacterium]REK50059.1 MAG: hypothetical protein DWQ48_05850 [Bacteroidota bacterium]
MDKFEEGVSTEHIHNIPLKILFEIFVDEYSAHPYKTQMVAVKRIANEDIISDYIEIKPMKDPSIK